MAFCVLRAFFVGVKRVWAEKVPSTGGRCWQVTAMGRRSPVHRGQSASTMARGPSPPPQSTCSGQERAIEWQAADGRDEAQRSKTRPCCAADARTSGLTRSSIRPPAPSRQGPARAHNRPRPAIHIARSRPARPAPHGAGRQAAASRRGVATGPRGCQAVPRARAARPKARHDFICSQVFSP